MNDRRSLGGIEFDEAGTNVVKDGLDFSAPLILQRDDRQMKIQRSGLSIGRNSLELPFPGRNLSIGLSYG